MYTYVCLHAISERNSKKKLIVIFVMVNYIKNVTIFFELIMSLITKGITNHLPEFYIIKNIKLKVQRQNLAFR